MHDKSNTLSLHSHEPIDEKAFYTELDEKDENVLKLKRYVNSIQNKIDYAKWKQNLVLKYNYMPMKRITEKVQNQRINYVKKIAEEEMACAKMLSGKEITVQLDSFRDFSKMLKQRISQIQMKISQENLRKQFLVQQVKEKRMRLKEIMKQNMQIIKSKLQREGISTKEDIISLVRSRSMKDRFNPTAYTIDSQKMTERKDSETKPKVLSSIKTSYILTNRLYQQCLQKLINSIQSMKSSQDIQSGIYLDIMDRNKNSYFSQAKYSLKSKICDTLHTKFGINHLQKLKNVQSRDNFEMDWTTFKELNWKQIMGILLVKDKQCEKMKKLLRFK